MSQPDFTFIEASQTNSFEASDGNNKWINKIEGGIVIPSGSKITVESAYINVKGADESVIEMTGRELKDNTVTKYVEEPDINGYYQGSFEEEVSSVKDNYVVVQLQYYKNADMMYYFPANYPYSTYFGDYPVYTGGGGNYVARCVPMGMNKVYAVAAVHPATVPSYHIKGEFQQGILSSTFASPYGYNFPHDSKRYTICQKTLATTFSLQPATNLWRRGGVTGLQWNRDLGLYHYYPYIKDVEINITKGPNTPSSIGEQVTQQLNKITTPEIVKVKCWEAEPAIVLGKAGPWTNYTEVNTTLKMTTPCLQAFEVGTSRTFSRRTQEQFLDPLINNDDLDAKMYDDIYKYIGIYNPDLFIAGRQVEIDPTFQSGIKSHRILNTHILNITAGTHDYVFETDLEYSEEILKPYSVLFNYQTDDYNFYENYCAKDINATKDNYVFLHMDYSDFNASVLPVRNPNTEWKTYPFGTDREAAMPAVPLVDFGNPLMTNALYIKYDKTQKNQYSENGAYGVFTPYRNLQVSDKWFCKFTATFRTTTSGLNDFFTFPLSNNIIYAAVTGMEQAMLAEVRKFGWDTHFSANGNQSIVLYNGMTNESNLKVNVPTKYTTEKTVGGSAIAQLTYSDFNRGALFSNSFNYVDDTLTSVTRFYDGGLNLLYLGSDNASLGFELTESRFVLKNFHTPRIENNTSLSGWDSLVTNLATGADGREQIFLGSSDTTVEKQVTVPLTINPNGNQPIYQISPNKVALEQNSIFGLGSYTQTYWTTLFGINFNADGLKTNTIFDSQCGIFIINFGVDEASFKESLWDVLGFTLPQVKNNNIDKHDFTNPIYLNRQEHKLNQGVNLEGDIIQYPYTSNADIKTSEIKSWKTNPYGISYFNTLTSPCNFRVISANIEAEKGLTPADIVYGFPEEVQEYQVTQNQTSTLLYASSLAKKTVTPFYMVRSDILQDQQQFFGGSKSQSSRLPCVALINKSNPGADYFTETSGSISYIIKNRLVINNITTEIYDNIGNLAENISPYSSIVYRIEKLYNVEPVSPFQTLGEFQENQQLEELKKKNKNKKNKDK